MSNLQAAKTITFRRNIDIVIYHDKCPDGKAGAWTFWREISGCTFYGFLHGQTPPNVDNKILVIVDFCFPRGVLEKMAKTAKHITILDHHESAQTDLEGWDFPSNVSIIFDMTRSGAQIAWDYVYPGVPRPWFIEIIADRDLWTWKIQGSKELGKGLFIEGWYTWQKMEELYSGAFFSYPNALEVFIKDMTKIGATFIKQEEREISAICAKSILAAFQTPDGNKYKIRIVGCSENHKSEVGNRLCERNPGIDFAVTWRYDFLLDEWWISCRGTKEKGINLAVLCKQFHRGGGHSNAAGFTIFGSDRILPKKELLYQPKETQGSEEGVFVKGEKLQTYFRPLEVPRNRPQDADLL